MVGTLDGNGLRHRILIVRLSDFWKTKFRKNKNWDLGISRFNGKISDRTAVKHKAFEKNTEIRWPLYRVAVKDTWKTFDDFKNKWKLYEVMFFDMQKCLYSESVFNKLYVEIKQNY